MNGAEKLIQELILDLPPDIRAEVRDFIEFLLAKRSRGRNSALRQDWARALRDYRDEYTSLELHRQGLAWRGDR